MAEQESTAPGMGRLLGTASLQKSVDTLTKSVDSLKSELSRANARGGIGSSGGGTTGSAPTRWNQHSNYAYNKPNGGGSAPVGSAYDSVVLGGGGGNGGGSTPNGGGASFGKTAKGLGKAGLAVTGALLANGAVSLPNRVVMGTTASMLARTSGMSARGAEANIFTNDYTSHGIADQADMAVGIQRMGYGVKTGGFQYAKSYARTASMIDPSLTHTNAAGAMQTLHSANTFNRMRMFGINTIGRGGAPKSPRDLANQILRRINVNLNQPGATIEGSLGQNSHFDVSLQNMVQTGALDPNTAEQVRSEARGILTARQHGKSYGQYNSTLRGLQDKDISHGAAKKTLQSLGINPTMAHDLMSINARKTNETQAGQGAFKTGLDGATVAVEQFSKAMMGFINSTAGQAFLKAEGAGAGMQAYAAAGSGAGAGLLLNALHGAAGAYGAKKVKDVFTKRAGHAAGEVGEGARAAESLSKWGRGARLLGRAARLSPLLGLGTEADTLGPEWSPKLHVQGVDPHTGKPLVRMEDSMGPSSISPSSEADRLGIGVPSWQKRLYADVASGKISAAEMQDQMQRHATGSRSTTSDGVGGGSPQQRTFDSGSGGVGTSASHRRRGSGNASEGAQGSHTRATGTVGAGKTAAAVIAKAKSYLGTPYVWGGTTPRGFDCSGLMLYCFGSIGVHLPRTASQQQVAGKTIPVEDARAGDLVFNGGNGKTGGAYHVMMLIGPGMVIEAPKPGGRVQIRSVSLSSLSSAARFLGSVGNLGDMADNSTGTGQSESGKSGAGYMGSAFVGFNINEMDTLSGALSGYAGMSGVGSSGTDSGVGGDPESGSPGAGYSGVGVASSTGGAVGGKVGDWIRKALGILGLPPAKYSRALNTIIQHESSGNPRAVNRWDSNAKAGHPSKGLMQTIDSTFDAYKMPGHNDIWNPVDNILAATRYAISRYGSMDNVPGIKSLNNGGGYKGYAVGSTNIDVDQNARVHKGEMIIPAHQAEAIRQALSGNTPLANGLPSNSAKGGLTLIFKDGAIRVGAVGSGGAGAAKDFGRQIVTAITEDRRLATIASGGRN